MSGPCLTPVKPVLIPIKMEIGGECFYFMQYKFNPVLWPQTVLQSELQKCIFRRSDLWQCPVNNEDISVALACAGMLQ